MKVLVSGGRTGGHLIPGIAIYEELQKRGIELKYVMSQFDLKYPITSKVMEADRILLEIKNISRKLSFRTPGYILKIMKTFFYVFKRIKQFNPDLIIITGGYISNPVALSALILGKPLYIAEQNSVSGVTNRLYARFARKIFTSFPQTGKIPQSKTLLTGNPSIFKEKTNRDEARRFFSLGGYSQIVGITGGSQGAKKINDAVLALLPYFLENRFGVIWSVGAVDYKRMEDTGRIAEITGKYPNVKVYQFIERMDHLFSAADIVITRAGATSIAEFINFTLPVILIPIKNSPDNHQLLNAKFLANASAGEILEEDKVTDESLIQVISKIYGSLKDYQEGMLTLKNTIYPEKPEKKIADYVLSR